MMPGALVTAAGVLDLLAPRCPVDGPSSTPLASLSAFEAAFFAAALANADVTSALCDCDLRVALAGDSLQLLVHSTGLALATRAEAEAALVRVCDALMAAPQV